MRIKMVCELTGLTDRTIRYYIDEQLISPTYTENYLGRKTFNFTEEDVDQLNHIAVLRKFDFSIEEIRELLAHPERSGRVILNVKARIENMVSQGQEALKAISNLSVKRSYTVAELARALLMPVESLPIKNDHKPLDIGGFLLDKFVQTLLFIITWLPIVLIVRNSLYSWWSYEYPHISWSSAVGCLAFVWPSIVLLFLHKFKFSRRAWKRRTAKVVLYFFSFLCAMEIMVLGNAATAVDCSHTTDPVDYMILDTECSDGWEAEFQMFPKRWDVDTEHEDFEYYYRFDRFFFHAHEYIKNHEIVVERHLTPTMYEAEEQRIRELFLQLQENQKEKLENDYYPENDDDYDSFEEREIGQYRCVMLYSSAPTLSDRYGKGENGGVQLIFAYNPSTNTARYIAFYSECGTTSHYSTLDWYIAES